MQLVNKKMFPNQIHYFFLYAGINPIVIFATTVAKQMGFSSSVVGFTFFCIPIIAVFGRVIFGMIADKFHALKLILVICVVGCATSSILFSFLPQLDKNWTETSVFCQPNGTNIIFSSQQGQCNDFEKCKVAEANGEKFANICSSWKQAAEINGLNSSTFDCSRVVIDIYVLKPAVWENTCLSGMIGKATSDMEISQPHCVESRNASCLIDCSENLSLTEEILEPSFQYFFLLINFISISYYVSITLTDTMSYNLFKEEPHLYGRTRVFGSFGGGLACLLTGFLIDSFSTRNSYEKNYLPMYIFIALMFIIDIFWSKFLKAHQDDKTKFDFKKVSNLFLHFDVIIFAIWAFLAGFYQQLPWQFAFWYLEEISNENEANWLKSLQGFYELCNTWAGDVFAFYASGSLVRKFGIKNCMTFVFLLSAGRFYAFSILQRPIWVLPVASIDGLIYGLEYALITSYSDSISAAGTKTTVQAIFNCVYDGIGTSVGGLCAGLAYSYFGGAMTFRIYAYISLGSCGLLILARIVSAFLKQFRKDIQ